MYYMKNNNWCTWFGDERHLAKRFSSDFCFFGVFFCWLDVVNSEEKLSLYSWKETKKCIIWNCFFGLSLWLWSSFFWMKCSYLKKSDKIFVCSFLPFKGFFWLISFLNENQSCISQRNRKFKAWSIEFFSNFHHFFMKYKQFRKLNLKHFIQWIVYYWSGCCEQKKEQEGFLSRESREGMVMYSHTTRSDR